MGLSPWQKMVFQLLVALIIAFFVYNSPYVGDKLYIPFTMREISLGWFAVPFYAVVFIAFTNAVNLTDGLDGLAGKTSVAYTVFFAAVISVIVYRFGIAGEIAEEYENMLVFCFALIGALCGFLLFNSYPAKIFMGDTGSACARRSARRTCRQEQAVAYRTRYRHNVRYKLRFRYNPGCSL